MKCQYFPVRQGRPANFAALPAPSLPACRPAGTASVQLARLSISRRKSGVVVIDCPENVELSRIFIEEGYAMAAELAPAPFPVMILFHGISDFHTDAQSHAFEFSQRRQHLAKALVSLGEGEFGVLERHYLKRHLDRYQPVPTALFDNIRDAEAWLLKQCQADLD